MIDNILAEMHAHVQERLPMSLTLEEVKEVLEALGRPFVHPGVELAKVQEGGAVEEVAVAKEKQIVEPKGEEKG